MPVDFSQFFFDSILNYCIFICLEFGDELHYLGWHGDLSFSWRGILGEYTGTFLASFVSEQYLRYRVATPFNYSNPVPNEPFSSVSVCFQILHSRRGNFWRWLEGIARPPLGVGWGGEISATQRSR
jgi:hypothetical protein